MTNPQMPQPPQKPVTAAQRLNDVESGLSELFNLANQVVKDVSLIKEALRLLDNKVSSIVQASTRGETISDDTIERIMIENNCDKLAQKVKSLVEQGFLVAENLVSQNAFIVGKETDAKDGAVLNPRVQFALQSLTNKDIQAKLLGQEVGATVNLEDGAALFTIVESYKIQTPQAPEAPPAPATAAPEETTDTTPETAPSGTDQAVASNT